MTIYNHKKKKKEKKKTKKKRKEKNPLYMSSAWQGRQAGRGRPAGHL